MPPTEEEPETDVLQTLVMSRLGRHQSNSRHHACVSHTIRCCSFFGRVKEIVGKYLGRYIRSGRTFTWGANTFLLLGAHSTARLPPPSTANNESKKILLQLPSQNQQVEGFMVYVINGGHINTAGKCLLLKYSHFWASIILQPSLSAPLTWLGWSMCRPWSFLSKNSPEEAGEGACHSQTHLSHCLWWIWVGESTWPMESTGFSVLDDCWIIGSAESALIPILLNKLEFSTA